jgi:hypothetical protein
MMKASFDSFCSYLYAGPDVVIHTASKEINQTRLRSPFPEFYSPTWKELFDAIARQTMSSWKYDSKRDYWTFNKPPLPLPFTMKKAEKWKAHDRGMYVSYQPSIAPVGLDVYMMGAYSIDKASGEGKLFADVGDAIALLFAQSFKEDVTPKEMTKVKVGSYEALHFKSDGSVIWRQWAIVKDGKAFIIVSAIKPEHEAALFPDVEKMLATFKILKSSNKEAK